MWPSTWGDKAVLYVGQGRGCDQTKKRPFLHKGACLYPAWQFKYYLLECETWSESERWGYVWLSYLGWCNQCFVISFGGTQTVCGCASRTVSQTVLWSIDCKGYILTRFITVSISSQHRSFSRLLTFNLMWCKSAVIFNELCFFLSDLSFFFFG